MLIYIFITSIVNNHPLYGNSTLGYYYTNLYIGD